MNDSVQAGDIQELLDRDAIRDVLYRYAHGIDRCDAEMLRTVYWPDGTDDHGDFKGTRDAFIDWVIPVQSTMMSMSQHLMVNCLIRFEGSYAHVETYFQAYQRWKDYVDEDASDVLIGGRYLDRMEKRGREWRIAERVVAYDYFREFADTGNWATSQVFNERRTLGGRAPHDSASEMFKESRLQPPFTRRHMAWDEASPSAGEAAR